MGGCGRGCGCGGSALCSIPFCNSQHLGPFCAFFFLSILGFVRCKRWRARGLANFESQNGHPAVCSATVADCNPAACRPAACSTTFAAFISAPPQSHRRVTDWTPDLIRASWSGSLGRPRSDPPRWYAIVLPGRKSAAGRRADFGVFPVAVRPKSGLEGRFTARKRHHPSSRHRPCGAPLGCPDQLKPCILGPSLCHFLLCCYDTKGF